MTIRRPLMIDTATSGLKEMSNSDMDYMRYVIRDYFANNEMAGWLRINSSPSGYVSAGAVTDRSRTVGRQTTNIGNVFGVGPTNSNVAAPGTESNNVYTLYQNRNDSTNVPSTAISNKGPLVANNTDYSDLIPMNYSSATDVFDTVIDDTIQDIEGGGNGRFYIGTSIPSGYTTTGYSMANRQTTSGSTSGPSSTTYTLSIRTGETAPTAVRPVRHDPNGGIIEMTDTEITDFFIPYLNNRVGEGDRLLYEISTTPSYTIDCGNVVETFYTSQTNASLAQLISGHTYYRDVTSLDTDTYYLRLYNS